MRSELACWALLTVPVWALAGESQRVDYARDVQPILTGACIKCHGEQKQQGGLRFDRPSGITRADSGSKTVVPGRAAESELVRRIESADASVRMPLDVAPLRPEQVQILRAWIDQGATWPAAADTA